MRKIDDLRLKIDELDQKILELIAQRLENVKQIGKIKKENGIGIIDENREKELLDRLIAKANDKGINPEVIKKVWKVLMEISYEIEGGKNGNG